MPRLIAKQYLRIYNQPRWLDSKNPGYSHVSGLVAVVERLVKVCCFQTLQGCDCFFVDAYYNGSLPG